MAIAPQLLWNERIQFSLARERESDAFSRTSDDDPESTYWVREDVERLHAEIGQRMMRIVPPSQVEQMGGRSTATPSLPRVGLVRRDILQGSVAMEQGIVRILAGSIQTSADAPFLPARGPVALAELIQLANLTGPRASDQRYFGLLGNFIVFSGYALRLLYVVEPQLSDFQKNAVYLPPAGSFELACDWVHQQLMAADWLPTGRV